jgi:phospho-N-acetylmuramoyl-pentapeptide-transferase
MFTTLIDNTLVSFLAAAIWAPILIWILYRLNLVISHKLMGNKMNAEFIKIHGHKSGTPRTGGLIISVPLFVLSAILLPVSDFKMVYLLGVLLFTLYGLSDDLLVSGRKISDKFRLWQETFSWRMVKLLLLFGIGYLLTYLIVNSLGIQEIILWKDLSFLSNIGLGAYTSLAIPVASWWAIAIMAFIIITAMYAIEVTDGVDGLVTGLFLILFVAFAVVANLTGVTQIMPVLGLLLGASFVYLYFNINPARVFMGGTGTFPIAFSLILFAIMTQTVLVFFVMGALFWLELLSSFLQIVAIRFFKRKLFKIAPLHHHLEAIGWPETKVVQRLWLLGMVMAVAGLWVYLKLFA